MDKPQIGKLIVSAAKSLKRFQLADINIAAFLYATSSAGRAGLFMSSLRDSVATPIGRVAMLAATEGFSPVELTGTLLPWFEANGLVRVRRQNNKIQTVDSLALTYDGLLSKVSDFYDSLDPRPEDRGAILTLELATDLPRLESEVLHTVASAIGEAPARTAVQLAKKYRIVASRTGKGLSEPVVYSEKVWKKVIGKAAQMLSSLKKTDREILLALVERVRKYQGIPESLIRVDAVKANAAHLVELAKGIGLLNRTTILMADGTSRPFLTSPHFFSDLEDEGGEDACDRVKIFLDSTRNGQHYGHPWTGRIADPDALLRKLLNTGIIGPCTAIGTDWVTSEKAGIIRISRENVKPGQSYMHLVQRDTVRRVHELIATGGIAPAGGMEASHVRDGLSFHSIEEARIEAGEVPEPIAEAERAIILRLREGAH